MSWMSVAAKTAVGLTVRHGPKVAAAWTVAGKPVTEAARAKAKDVQMRSQAVRDAETRNDGRVLALSRGGRWLWVVYSGDEPVAVYPSIEGPLADLVATAKLSDRFTPAQYREAQLLARAQRVGQRTGHGVAQVGRAAGRSAKRLTSRRSPDDGDDRTGIE